MPEPSTPTPDVPTVSSCPKCKGGHVGAHVFPDTNPANAYHFCLDCCESFNAPLPAWAEVTRQRDAAVLAYVLRQAEFCTSQEQAVEIVAEETGIPLATVSAILAAEGRRGGQGG